MFNWLRRCVKVYYYFANWCAKSKWTFSLGPSVDLDQSATKATRHSQEKLVTGVLFKFWFPISVLINGVIFDTVKRTIKVHNNQCTLLLHNNQLCDQLLFHAQHITVSSFFCCWSDNLELIARRHAVSGVFCGQLQAVTKDIFIFVVLVCSAH